MMLATKAAHLARDYRLSLADSIVYACAVQEGVILVTSDAIFKNLPGVEYHDKTGNPTL